jgi:hypothetical protein
MPGRLRKREAVALVGDPGLQVVGNRGHRHILVGAAVVLDGASAMVNSPPGVIS